MAWRRIFILAGSIVGMFCISACSATKFVPEGEYLLDKNVIEVSPKKPVSAASLTSFLRQKPNTTIIFGWKSFLNLYSLSSFNDNGWSRFFQRIGEAPVIFDSVLVERSNTNLDNHLNSLGYYDNVISNTVSIKHNKAKATYHVKLGNTYTIDSFQVQIADTALQRIYQQTAENSLVKKGQFLSVKTLDAESERIASEMRNNGFYAFTKNYVSFSADTLAHDGNVSLQLHINNYQRSHSPEDAIVHKKYKLRNISVYTDYDPFTAAMDSTYEERLRFMEYNGMDIFFSKKPTIRPGVIRRLNFLRSGDMYNEEWVNDTYSRFGSISLYNGITLLFDQVPAPDSVAVRELDCAIRLNPGNSQGYKLNLEASSNSNGLIGISPALSYYHKNIFRGGEWLTLGFMGNFQFKLNDPTRSTEWGTSLSLSFPRMLFPIPSSVFKKYVPKTDLASSYNFQKRPEYTRNIASFRFGYTWQMGERFFYTVNPLKLNLVKLYNMSPDFIKSLTDPFLIDRYRDHFDLGLSTVFYFTTDNAPVHRRNYFYVRVGYDAAGNVLSAFNGLMKKDSTGAHTAMGIAYSQYMKTDVNTAYTWIFSPKHQFAARFYAGIGVPYGNSHSLPLEQMFYSGGANSLRGWQARTVGPGSMPIDSTFSIPNQSGDIKLEANIEYRFTMFWKIEGAIFADAGNIWTVKKKNLDNAGTFHWNNFYKSLAVDVGLGIRLNMDFVILRLDFGQIIRDPVKRSWIPFDDWFSNDTCAIQFGVGYPF